jgi:hypothetical protein
MNAGKDGDERKGRRKVGRIEVQTWCPYKVEPLSQKKKSSR